MKKTILFLVIVILWLPAYAQTDISNYTVDSIATLSLNSPYHCSEGLVMRIGADSLFNIFRLDTTLNHVSTHGKMVKRFSYDGGNTWSAYQVVFDSPYDDRNLGGGIVNGRIMIFFSEYDSVTQKRITGGMYSFDKGETFITNVPLSLPLIDTYSVPYGPIIKVDSGKYYQTFVGGTSNSSNARLVQCIDTVNMVWGNTLTIFDTTDGGNFSEVGVVYFSKDSLIAHVRHDAGDYTYEQYVSSNNGTTWLYIGTTNIGTATGTFRAIAPWFAYDSIRKEIIELPAIRHDNPTNDNILCYINNGHDVFSIPTAWTLKDSVKRPLPSSTSMYGYVTTTWLNDSTLFCIMTDDSVPSPATSSLSQFAALYQFKIIYHTPVSPVSIAKINLLENNINISPNPANDDFTISNKQGNEENIQVKIIDESGRICKTTNTILSQNPVSISTSDMLSGNYFIEILYQGIKTVKPLVILH